MASSSSSTAIAINLETVFQDRGSPKKKANQSSLSDLPDEMIITILSLVPTRTAARTSVLCRRFHHLWEASPSLQFCSKNFVLSKIDQFVAMVDHALICRSPSQPLQSLRLELSRYQKIHKDDSFLCSLLVKAQSLGLRHLTIENLWYVVRVLPTIFSIDSLESLSLPIIIPYRFDGFPSGFGLTCLRSLSLRLYQIDSSKLHQLLSELCSLEDLYLHIKSMDRFILSSLSSQTIRKLHLTIGTGNPEFKTLRLFLPSLEMFHLENLGFLHIHGEVPLLKRALISLYEVHAEDVNAITKMLNCISHVEELSLHVTEYWGEKNPIPSFISLKPGNNMPIFPNLKHLGVGRCFHEHDIEALIMMLHKCPVLESVMLVHEVPKFHHAEIGMKEKDWESKLPLYDDGNYIYAYCTNLHLGENRKELVELLRNRSASKSFLFEDKMESSTQTYFEIKRHKGPPVGFGICDLC
ncbi:F-box family protein [Rhynchospora pubera]|uniref:F-box family protein n=1 Tax=Rhynchospora pubera TaxID=906938 RepID=A0AAV8EFW9_9POAL|nr:F-box family protein [Rhynchospora pubera]